MSNWRVSGSYLESCNCEVICPCRRIDGVMGGRSTYGICLGALSWRIAEGHANGVALDGLGVVLACRYSDDEEGSPWSFVLYVDELEAIFTGRLRGSQVEHFRGRGSRAIASPCARPRARGQAVVLAPRGCERRRRPRRLPRSRHRDGAPGIRDHYHPTYCAAFVHDPDS